MNNISSFLVESLYACIVRYMYSFLSQTAENVTYNSEGITNMTTSNKLRHNGGKYTKKYQSVPITHMKLA